MVNIKLMPEKLRELREKQEAATLGPWNPWEDTWVVGPIPDYDEIGTNEAICNCSENNDRANTAYIAAFNPETCLALLDEIEMLREQKRIAVEALEGAYHDPIEDDHCGCLDPINAAAMAKIEELEK